MSRKAAGPAPAGLAAGRAFDRAAARYDADFACRPLGRELRARVWRVLDGSFSPGEAVLDLGAGTGEDALHLAARGVAVLGLDPAPGMAARAAAKARRAGLSGRAAFAVARMEALPLTGPAAYDGALADFGAVNCVAEVRPVARALAGLVRPGGRLVWVPMGPFSAWESAWFLARGRPRQAARRWRPAGVRAWVAGRPVAVHYPNPAALAAACAPWFRRERLLALGLALTSTDAAGWAEARAGRLARLAALEDRLATLPGAAWCADHYILVLSRGAAPP